MAKILAVCKTNTASSAMFEGYVRRKIEESGLEGAEIESAGLLEKSAGRPANGHAITAMWDHNVDLRWHRSRWIGSLNLGDYTYIMAMDKEVHRLLLADHRCQQYRDRITLVAMASGGIASPYAGDLATHDQCVKKIAAAWSEAAIFFRLGQYRAGVKSALR